jgi:hypothetical protein
LNTRHILESAQFSLVPKTAFFLRDSTRTARQGVFYAQAFPIAVVSNKASQNIIWLRVLGEQHTITEVFAGISFALPACGKLKVARDIGERCGTICFGEGTDSLPRGLPDEVAGWSAQCRATRREELFAAWHGEQQQPKREAPAPSTGTLVGYARVATQEQDTALKIDALKAAG